jgi:hypothetical protein
MILTGVLGTSWCFKYTRQESIKVRHFKSGSCCKLFVGQGWRIGGSFGFSVSVKYFRMLFSYTT